MEVIRPVNFDSLAGSREFAEFSTILGNLAGITMALNDPDSSRGVFIPGSYNASPLCRLIWSVPAGSARCEACGKGFCDKAAQCGHAICLPCHAGLIDMAIPIFAGERHIATITCGQLLPSPPSESGLKEFIKRNRYLRLPVQTVRDAFFQAPYMPEEQIDAIQRLLRIFAEQVCNADQRLHELAVTSRPDEVALAKQYIRDHFHETISLDVVADAVGLSPVYLSKRFPKVVGKGFTEYVQTMRVAHAKDLLACSKESITQVALACGFGSLSQFSRVFRKFTKCSPSGYRHKHRRTAQAGPPPQTARSARVESMKRCR